MTRPATSPRPASTAKAAAAKGTRAPSAEFTQRLDADPAAVVVEMLRAAGESLTATDIKARFVAAGATEDLATRAWPRARDKLRFDDHVTRDERNAYRYVATPRPVSATEALERLARNPGAAKQGNLLEVIRSALEGGAPPDELAQARARAEAAQQRIEALERELKSLAIAVETDANTPQEQYARAEKRRAARERQARIDAMSAVAELAAEVEELTAKRASLQVLLDHTRALTEGSGLEAIGRAGEPIPYDEEQHHPVADFPNEGEQVTVIRPGYLWHAPGEAVLISKALVTRA